MLSPGYFRTLLRVSYRDDPIVKQGQPASDWL